MPDETTQEGEKGKKESRGVKPGTARGPYVKKPEKGCKEDLDAAFLRIQALEDKVTRMEDKGKKEEPAAEPIKKLAEKAAMPPAEEEDWL
ncbi:MAG: hypothetical protein M0Z48_04420 [Nitrospiraceae bacterium]|nr:hypothetical protein [Nitrospiraceae bacterium]